ncbi:DUF3060 domain-containing protein [[Mycobacterium] vasticus]|uniref:DUF3060 domain-containing protein n=1 Tax=[Mycobacterium] vasticus TaxID=2875777 RepID=A0ABU5YS24_9MYCO|nr:DUF3060 domain-containing protein [Mycolicibacter sp. MYC017]MEB3067715.1 DUF3060 domain-containing protein [Mycolicibacter sp. MYC017]
MNADDDPEARIRELERPLSDFARSAELTVPSAGIDGHASPPRSEARAIGVVIGAIAAVLVAGAAVAVFLVVGAKPSTPSSHPTIGRGVAAAPPGPPVPGRGATITITGAGETKTLDCVGNYVTVTGVNNTVTLTGDCAGLTVSGIGNIITVDAVPTIAASGLNNRVTYRSGNPKVGTSGLDNVVVRG